MTRWKSRLLLGTVLLALPVAAFRLGLGARTTAAATAVAEPLASGSTSGPATFPEPPQQRAAWKPPKTSLSADLLAATGTLFLQGLADPRGCEYRVIEITVGESTGGPGEHVSTHGWVLPGTGERRYAVCWNGLVYPVLTVGAPADLRRDVLTVVEPVERKRKGAPSRVFGGSWAVGEAGAVSVGAADRLRSCLLLRLGEEELARRMWAACAEHPVQHEKGPYLDLATDLLWYLFDRTVGAHVRGDDPLALAGARLLVRAQAAVEAESARQGYERPDDRGPRPGSSKPPYIDFGTDPADLLADQEERAAHSSAPLGVGAAGNATGPERRVATLIRALNEVSERQLGQPGGVYLPGSSTVQALVKEGERAVTPLIDCLETDTRLTRSAGYWRNFARHRSVLPVRSAALSALEEILKTTRFGAEARSGDEGWHQLAVKIRAYWKRYQDVPRFERWYRVLQDDAAGPAQWLEAAANLTLPAEIEGQPGVMSPLMRSFGSGGRGRRLGSPLKGEALRAKRDPSVTSLLEKRAAEVARRVKPDDVESASTAVDLALCLSAWDPPAALPTLRREFRRCETLSRTQKAGFPAGFDPDNNAWYLAELTLARARGKDPAALGDYTRWPLASRPVFPFEPQGIFEPLWRYPTDPAVITASRTLFNAPGSAWRREVEKRAGGGFNGQSFVDTPLLGLPAFRELVYRLLADRSPAGTAGLSADGQLEVTASNSSMSASGGNTHDPLAPKPGVKVPIRKCDLVGWTLSRIDGAPDLQPYWPMPNRDAALRRMMAFLRRYGPRLGYSDLQEEMDDGTRDSQTALTFSPLDHPAAPEEVRENRAIFSLAGQGEVRVVALPKRPMRARWVTLKKYPFDAQIWDEKTNKPRSTTEYWQDGWVWQAEEVQANGKWQRFYGLVGPHEVAKVPAAEIEFPTGPYAWNEWGQLQGGLDCRVRFAGDDKDRGRDVLDPPRLAAAPTVEVLLRNRSGLPQAVPSRYQQQEASGLRLLEGLELQLSHSTPLPSAADQNDPKAEGRRKWEPVPLRLGAALRLRERDRTLQPAESFTAFSLKLEDVADLRGPALYRLQLHWTRGPGGVGGIADGKSNELRFVLSP
jgi:hypothetical protein